ncbi:MAG: GNAT family N-acetyltransferase [Gracilibacteraceae bacterium]|nr:GNAT family N-acetyltransferase [Gracilibacteraceae bacterium]
MQAQAILLERYKLKNFFKHAFRQCINLCLCVITVNHLLCPPFIKAARPNRPSGAAAMIDIRHTLNQFLREYGGNIGYSVRPSERNKGYAAEILKQGLEYCKTIHLKKVMLACNKDNKASSRTIEKCGGVLEREFIYLDGKTVQVYGIDL